MKANSLWQDSYLAGFTDGEGSFNISRVDKVAFQPIFQIRLRADDTAILVDLQKAFGGQLRWSPQPAPNANPQLNWIVRSKESLRLLVKYFDRFPLRAKKARDYVIWKEAVCVYIAKGRTAPELPILKDQLSELRKYDSSRERDWQELARCG